MTHRMFVEKNRDNLPEGWKIVNLDSILDRITNGTTETQSQEPIGFPVTRIETISHGVIDLEKVRYIKELDQKKRENFLLKEGDILFSHINSDLHLGKTAVVQKEKDLIHGMNLLLLRVKDDVSPKYIHYLFNLLRARGEFIAIAQHAVNQSSLNQQKLKKLEIPLAPPEQQKQIVAKIEELFSHIDAGIDALKQSKQLLKQYRQSVLKAAVTGELSKEWREQHKEFRAEQLIKRIIQEKANLASDPFYKRHKTPEKVNDDEKYFDIPYSWEWVRMAEVCLKITDGAHNTPKTLDHGFPYITAKDVVKGRLDFSCRQYISEKEHKELFNKCRPEPGDLLVVNIGAGSGNSALVPSAIDFEFSFKNIAILKLSKNIHPPYIYWYQEYRKEIVLLEQTRGGAQPFLSLAILNSLLAPLPPKEEQEVICSEIERMVSTIVELEKSINAELQRSERLKQSVLQSAFGGNFTEFYK